MRTPISSRSSKPDAKPPGFISGESRASNERVMAEMLVLRLPRRDEDGEFLRAHRATTPGAAHFLHYYDEGMSLSRYLGVQLMKR